MGAASSRNQGGDYFSELGGEIISESGGRIASEFAGKMSELEENRLLDSEFQTISSEPLIGRLNLETDLGTIGLLVNKEAAEFLISMLLEFLAEGAGEDAPKFTVHTEQ